MAYGHLETATRLADDVPVALYWVGSVLIAALIVGGRLVEAEDIAAAVTFLCSPDAEMVRGHILVVDGGFSLPA